ncbi:PREDICTED: guanine nucleotide-binding protein subunit beta-like protein 1 isoform X1 [Gavialis gangeticus]|uniref:guanine nucleotide-binding protein subunit beta-like protein 1 isoform X1 n=2 Tax=Gavialis gangeticus TaxID=94835 RepID=UPI00092F8C99|nr:PREDICTED: guanine nucleotide-binding protein subunit beta-like protein 1 isoform X1 [Gavialis gangeticus]XP_019362514.1 PREDICTED: guanine nucleotide-binding protein subunit beta-like protein 1 isoform X1 [Gavialis gangeticus]XP_019362515.1 PREDICTED: guanine nucleotide-binding protein subunit beta-like protein 1 isoform X1 [Gavialis gangeticus]XP_019362516.1 PREDICTED: guanine nucleotide-binding protein subunit beta-like protein 1 isoform X1 [Gavialis gangeticus]
MTKQLVERKMMTALMSSPGFSVCSLFECSYFWMIATMALPPPDPEFVLRGTAAPVHTLHFSCRGQEPEFPILFSGSANGLVQIWNLKTHRVDTTLDGHGGKSVYWVETIRGRDELLSQGRDQKICLWDLAEGRSMVTDSISMDSVGFCRCSLLKMAQDRWLIAMPANDPDEVQVLELPSKTSVCTLKPEAGAKLGMPMCLKLWQPGFGACPFLMAGYEDGSVILWNLSMGKMLSRLACHQEPVMSLDFDSEKAKGVSGSSEKVLSVWSLDEQQNLKVHKTHELINSGISDVTIRQDRKILATAGWDYRIRIFGWKKMKPLAVLDFHTATVHCVSFSDHSSPSERLLAAGSKDHRISIWSLYNQT